MKTQLSEVFQATLYLTGYIAPFVLVAFFILKKWGKTTLAESKQSDEQQYNEKYAEIQEQIKTFHVCRENKKLLLKFIHDLEALNYQNQEKTDMLYQHVYDRFQTVRHLHEPAVIE